MKNTTIPRTMLSVACLLLFPLTSSQTMAKLKLTWWDPYGPPFNKVIENIISDFNKSQNNIVVTRQMIPFDGMVEKMALMQMNGKGPDMAHVWHSSSACQLWAMGLTRSMDEYIARDKQLWDAVYPAYMDSLKFRGKQLGFPDQAQAAMMYWNTDMFSQAGLDPGRAPSFEELEVYAAKLTKKKDNGKIDVLGFNPVNTWAGFTDWAYFYGGQLFDRKTEKITVNTESNIKALSWLASFVKLYGGIGNMWAAGSIEGGKVAMQVGQQYIMKNIAASKKKIHFTIGMPPIPGGISQTRGPLAGLDCNIVLRGTKHPNEAYQFMKFFISRGGWMQPDTPDPSPYRTLNERFNPPPIVPEGTWKSVVLRVLDYARPSLSMPGVDKFTADLNKVVDQVYQGKMSPQQALTQAQSAGEKYLNEALKRARWGR